MNVKLGRATEADWPEIEALVRRVALPLGGLHEHLGTTLVARIDGGEIGGCAALEPYGDAALLRSVAVAPSRQGRGVGHELTRSALGLARELGVDRVFLLTETAGDFFRRFGFATTNRADVPEAVRASVEFTTLCPESAEVMGMALSEEREVLGRRDKELVAIGASVAAGCRPCTRRHIDEARAAGATDDQLRAAVDEALDVRRDATDVIAGRAAGLLGDAVTERPGSWDASTLLRELTAVAAAFAVSCPETLARHVASARRLGATDEQIDTAVSMARCIKGVAASQVEKAADPSLAAADPSTAAALATPGCGGGGGTSANGDATAVGAAGDGERSLR